MSNPNHKKRGTRFEHRVKKHLEKAGCDVFRSAGSRSPADLIALHPDKKCVYFIQCKISDPPYLPTVEKAALISLAERHKGKAYVVGRNPVTYKLCIFAYNENSRLELVGTR